MLFHGESRYLRTSRLARIDYADVAGRQGWRFRAAMGYGLYPTNSALPDFVGSENLQCTFLFCVLNFLHTFKVHSLRVDRVRVTTIGISAWLVASQLHQSNSAPE